LNLKSSIHIAHICWGNFVAATVDVNARLSRQLLTTDRLSCLLRCCAGDACSGVWSLRHGAAQVWLLTSSGVPERSRCQWPGWNLHQW